MSLIVKSRVLGHPRLSIYAVNESDSKLEFWINHSRKNPSFYIQFPTELRIEDTVGVFRYIATLEPPHIETPINMCVYYADKPPVSTDYALDVNPSEIFEALQGAGHVRLNLPARYFARSVMPSDHQEPVLSVISSGSGPVPEYLTKVLPQLGLSMPQGTLESALNDFQTELNFFQTLAAKKN